MQRGQIMIGGINSLQSDPAKQSGLLVPIAPGENEGSSVFHGFSYTSLQNESTNRITCQTTKQRFPLWRIKTKRETLGTRQIPRSVVTTAYARKHSNALSFLPLGPRKLISFIFLMCFIQICLANQQVATYWFLSLQFCHNRARFSPRAYLPSRDRRGQENNMTF